MERPADLDQREIREKWGFAKILQSVEWWGGGWEGCLWIGVGFGKHLEWNCMRETFSESAYE